MRNIYWSIFLTALAFECLAKDFYVSPQGYDSNPGSISRPFLTLQKATEASLAYLKQESVTVWLLDGTHYVSNTLILDNRFSPGENKLTIRGYGKNVWIKGSKQLTGLKWRDYNKTIKVTELPENVNFDQLFINNHSQIRARFPNYDYDNPLRDGSGYQEVTGGPDQRYDTWLGYDSLKFSTRKWSNPQTGIVHAFQSHNWGNMQYRVKDRDYENNKLLLGEGGWQLQRSYGIGKGNTASPFYVENIFEELDSPGEWFLDQQKSLLYYYPAVGLDLENATFEVPTVKDIIQIKGSADKPVRNISIHNINFSQARSSFLEPYEPLARGDWAIHRGGAIFMEGTENCQIEDCNFEQLGGNAIFMSSYNRNNTVRSVRFMKLGESAICFVGMPSSVRFYQTWDDAEIHGKDWAEMRKGMDLKAGPKSIDYPFNCVVENAVIHQIGLLGKQTAGVFISMSHQIRASHITIHDTPRAGICINDGTWGGHIIENCDIWETVKETGEHGPFNAWGRERQWTRGSGGMIKEYVLLDAIDPVTIRNNRISNFRKTISAGNWTIDLDDGSSNYEIYNNLSLGSTLKLRDGFLRKVYNNIMVSPVPLGWHVWPEQSDDEFTNNIVVIAGTVPGKDIPTTTYIGSIRMPTESLWGKIHDRNLYWNVNTKIPYVHDKVEFNDWKKAGYDTHSLEANPLFVSPEKMDYRVKPNSPALQLGFKNFAMDNFGHTMTKIGPFWKEFENKALITIHADKRGGTVYYTTDGSTPTAKSNKYMGPFEIKESSYVKAITVDNQGEEIGFGDEAFYKKVNKVVYPAWFQALISGKQNQVISNVNKSASLLVDGLVLINIQDEPDLIDASGGYNSGSFIEQIDSRTGDHWKKAGIKTNMIIQGIQNEEIKDNQAFQKALKEYSGQTVSVKIVYGYENKIFNVQLP
ncbi:chitobiase/beta-hexosaminidase C-terminal domain-containing protein [Dyadobacter tibetensis]|uniref:chitobiase/beta-hexosaminidase C-terminal domain-containing protein n=1 Tax=Dyadobacter tibetensis TaxID=1211851 RepID=UPI00046F7B2B|nr:chitobiase/beta-hexosaminidase C-terminal domain-containing protein [Dyadobacter tibetensis]